MNNSKLAKTIVQAAAGKVPGGAGPILASIVANFWPTSGPNLWDEIKGQVQALITQDINQYNTLQNKLHEAGIKDEVFNYASFTKTSQQKSAAMAIHENILEILPSYLHGNPGQNMSIFWGTALLHMSVLNDLASLYGDATNQKMCAQFCQMYAYYGQIGAFMAYNNRLNEVKINSQNGNYPGKASIWVADCTIVDTGDNNKILCSFTQMYRDGWPANVLADQVKFNEEFASKWNVIQANANTLINSEFINAIEIINQNHPYQVSDVQTLLNHYMMSGDFTIFKNNYAGTQQIEIPPTATLYP